MATDIDCRADQRTYVQAVWWEDKRELLFYLPFCRPSTTVIVMCIFISICLTRKTKIHFLGGLKMLNKIFIVMKFFKNDPIH